MNPNSAVSDATRRSQYSANTKPPAIAGPLIAPTRGLGKRATVPNAAMLDSTSRSRFARSPPNCVMSIPEQKAVPAPVRTAQPT